MSDPHDRALGALLGLAVGDTLGMPTQSLSRAAIAERYGVVDRLLDGADDQPIAPKLPAGTVTDDTEQVLLLARILLDHDGHVPARVFAGALEAWEQDTIRRGSLDLLGPSTRRALTRLADGAPPDLAGRDGVTNGAVMRVAPVGVAHTGPRLLDAVVESAVVTHHTAPGIAAAAAVSAGVSGAGLPAALVTAASLGGDTDTVAAICGAVHGAAALPADLVATVRRVNAPLLDPLDDVVEGLLRLRPPS